MSFGCARTLAAAASDWRRHRFRFFLFGSSTIPQKTRPRRPDVDASVAALIGDGFADAPPRATSAPPHLEQLWAAQGVRRLVFSFRVFLLFFEFFLLLFVFFWYEPPTAEMRAPGASAFVIIGFSPLYPLLRLPFGVDETVRGWDRDGSFSFGDERRWKTTRKAITAVAKKEEEASDGKRAGGKKNATPPPLTFPSLSLSLSSSTIASTD